MRTSATPRRSSIEPSVTKKGCTPRRAITRPWLTPISSDSYRFSDHPAYLRAFRASIAKVAALDCDILLTPHPSASDMVKRFGAGKPLLDPDGCRKYAAGLSKQLDERLAKEAAAK